MFRVTVDRRVINYRPSATATVVAHASVVNKLDRRRGFIDNTMSTCHCESPEFGRKFQREVPFGAIHKTRPQNSGIFTLSALVHLCPLLPDSYPPLVDVHFIWLHFNTVTLSSDSRYTLTIDMCLFLTQT